MGERDEILTTAAERFSIICVSPQDRRVALPMNRQQVMLRAARQGRDVLFIEMGYLLGRHFWSLLRGLERRSLAGRLFSTEDVLPGVRLRKAHNLPWGSTYRFSKAIKLRRHGASAPAPRRRLAATRRVVVAGKPFAVTGLPHLARMEP